MCRRHIMGFDKRNLALPVIVAVAAIITMNAVIAQDGKHPAPLGSKEQHQKTARTKTSAIDPKILTRKSRPEKTLAVSPRSKPEPDADTAESNEDGIGRLLRDTAEVKKKSPRTETGLLDSKKIRFVQNRLAQLGFEPGPADGVMGQKTREAIKKFEYSRKIPVTGKISPTLVEALSQRASVAAVKLT